ncbi:MAG: M20/M25/M40 family metallo-hydrolase [Solirubrobacteraceae bacterium]
MLTRDGSITDLFLELAAIPSPSGRERALAEQIRDWLSDNGVQARFDDAGARNGSDAGNLIARVPGAAAAPILLFVAHMDTVESGEEPVRPALGDDGVIRSAGATILGADNKSAVAATMRLCRSVLRLPVERRPSVVVAFTCREESGRMGASLLDLDSLEIDCAFSVDGSFPIGTVITRALGQTTFEISVHGRAAHAAANPEAGINAIAVAGEIVAALPLGRRPGGGSVSIAAIIGGAVIDRLGPGGSGGLGAPGASGAPGAVATAGDAVVRAALAATPTNSVPDVTYLRGEVRGYTVDEMQRTSEAIERIVAGVCVARGARYEWARDCGRMVPPLPGAPDSRALSLVRAAAQAIDGVELTLQDGHATLEANYFAATTDVVAVASGGQAPHQTSESISVTELVALEALLTGIVACACACVAH